MYNFECDSCRREECLAEGSFHLYEIVQVTYFFGIFKFLDFLSSLWKSIFREYNYSLKHMFLENVYGTQNLITDDLYCEFIADTSVVRVRQKRRRQRRPSKLSRQRNDRRTRMRKRYGRIYIRLRTDALCPGSSLDMHLGVSFSASHANQSSPQLTRINR